MVDCPHPVGRARHRSRRDRRFLLHVVSDQGHGSLEADDRLGHRWRDRRSADARELAQVADKAIERDRRLCRNDVPCVADPLGFGQAG